MFCVAKAFYLFIRKEEKKKKKKKKGKRGDTFNASTPA
jgi:hypothetical protein